VPRQAPALSFRKRATAMMAHLFPALALPPAVRARVSLMRERAAGPTGMTITCGGASMEPVIRRGDAVRIRNGRPRRGAVAAFVTPGGDLELHRLIARGPFGWWAHLGDNQAAPAVGLVHTSQLIGIADVPARPPGPLATARAALRFARAGLRLAQRRRPRPQE